MAGHLLRDLSGKVALITGSSSGIGRATAELFAKYGCQVTVCGRNKATLEETKEMCLAAGLKEKQVLAVAGELTDDKYLEELASASRKHFGKLDILVNNAGGGNMKPLRMCSLQDFDELININLRSVVGLTQLCLPDIVKSKGNIIFVSTIGALLAFPEACHYTVAKAGLNQYAKNLTIDAAQDGVRVNIVSPGMVVTNIARDPDAKAMFEEHGAKIVEQIPLKKPGQPIDIAKMIAFLASEDSHFVTGGNFVSDGGSATKGSIDMSMVK